MKCPICGRNDTQVLESRSVDDGESIRRRRECTKCGRRFTTYEKTKRTNLWVVKKDGTREPFDKEKIKRGILRSIEKRPVSLELVDEIVGQIEKDLLREEKQEVSSAAIGKKVLARLKNIDKVAWIRFASVYLEFERLSDFEKYVKK